MADRTTRQGVATLPCVKCGGLATCWCSQRDVEAEMLREDAARWRALCAVLDPCVGGGVEVRDEALIYEAPEPGKEVRLFWYPDTPVGFYEVHGSSLRAAVDALMASE